MNAGHKLKILFLCTGNSCRSQMAEGWARARKGDRIEAFSAGIETHGLNPQAVQVMAEAGVDISGHRSKTVAELPTQDFDYVVTVCDHAHESCPIFPGKTKVVHAGFDDPPRLAKNARTEEESLAPYRRVRDEIKAFVETLPEALNSSIPGRANPPGEPGSEALRTRLGRDASPYPTAVSSPPVLGRANPPGEPKAYPKRMQLPHEVPLWVKQGARHFITINCKQRVESPLLRHNIAQSLMESAAYYDQLGHWYLWLMVIMPDHIHLIATFNLDKGIQNSIRAWKSYQATHLGIGWQSGFFEHRLRDEKEFEEKSHYVRWNPVRKGLVQSPEKWLFTLDRTRLGRDASPYPTAASLPPPSGRANPPGEPGKNKGEKK